MSESTREAWSESSSSARPPGRSTRAISTTAACASGTCCSTRSHQTTSTLSSGSGSSVARPWQNSTSIPWDSPALLGDPPQHPVGLDPEHPRVRTGEPRQPTGHRARAAADVDAAVPTPYVAGGQRPRAQPLDRRRRVLGVEHADHRVHRLLVDRPGPEGRAQRERRAADLTHAHLSRLAQPTQVVAVGRASSRPSGIIAPHTVHTPYVLDATRASAASISARCSSRLAAPAPRPATARRRSSRPRGRARRRRCVSCDASTNPR